LNIFFLKRTRPVESSVKLVRTDIPAVIAIMAPVDISAK